MARLRTPRKLSFPRRQQGAVLLIMLIILVVGVATVLVSSFNSSAINIARAKTSSQALAQAKEALIGYAITYADTHSGTVPGYLPCPDLSGTGGTPPSEGSSNT